ncbi:MAG: ABC transporter substrate-binding protein [Chitinivibrionales bacterium]|nr:ABC transporter substrate-binding protein [Chitinivibrionales bacterium]
MKNSRIRAGLAVIAALIVCCMLLLCSQKKDQAASQKQSTTGAVPAGVSSQTDNFVLATFGNVQSLDPAVAYDVESSMRVWNIYQVLAFFDSSATDKFKPIVCTEIPSIENGGISADGKTYTFTIRDGITFHEGGTLTPDDVVYSFKRNMITDPDGGPMWMLLEALTGYGNTRDENGKLLPGIFEKIDKCVETQGNKVVFHLPKAYPPFIGIIAFTCSAILDKEWAIEKGCWDGVIANAAKFNNPAPGHEPLQRITNGSGPYKLKSWESEKDFILERFDGYIGPKKPAIKLAIIKYVPEWPTRKLMLQNGDADRVSVPSQYVPEVKSMKGVRVLDCPQLAYTSANFCQKINPKANSNIGSGKLDGQGIPPNFFSDINVRKAFLHAFDSKTYARDVFNDRVIIPSSPNVVGLPFHKDVPTYEFDLNKSKEYLQKAWGGKVWSNGFKMIITHNTGNEMREAAAHMLAENVSSLNPKFKIEVQAVDWKDYVVQYRAYMYPIFIIGWSADYADPHNFLYTFMHSNGAYGKYMGYKNAEVDKLCDEGIATIETQKRDEIYTKLQNLWYTEALAVNMYQEYVPLAYRDNVKGFVLNPMFSDAMEVLWEIYK